MIKRILIAIMVLYLILPLVGKYRASFAFLGTAVDVNATITKTNGTEFTSAEVNLQYPPDVPDKGIITVVFTRAAGSASTVDFYFQVSFDGGTTWANYRSTISIPTNEPVISGTTCRVSTPVNFAGVSHMRLWKIVNGDTANNLTACNAYLSY